MYAIITDGSRQFKVEQGQELVVDFRDKPAGEKIKFEKVLAVGGAGDAKLGSPLLKGASVTAEVIGPVQGEKLVVQKFRRRKNFKKKTGFRSVGTKVRIAEISA